MLNISKYYDAQHPHYIQKIIYQTHVLSILPLLAWSSAIGTGVASGQDAEEHEAYIDKSAYA